MKELQKNESNKEYGLYPGPFHEPAAAGVWVPLLKDLTDQTEPDHSKTGHVRVLSEKGSAAWEGPIKLSRGGRSVKFSIAGRMRQLKTELCE